MLEVDTCDKATPLTVASMVNVYLTPLLTVQDLLKYNDPVPLLDHESTTLLPFHSVKVASIVLLELLLLTWPEQ